MNSINLVVHGFKKVGNVEDDNNVFTIFTYKGLPVSYLYDDYLKEYYVSLRLDYCLPYDFKNYKEDLSILDEFNGVAEIDINKLISNCEYIINKYNINKCEENEEC